MFGWVVHGYVLMDNHYHLIVQIVETNLSRGMQWFQTSYSMAFNRRHGRVGPLVQGRYRAVLVDPIGSGLDLSRYVHLNPARTARSADFSPLHLSNWKSERSGLAAREHRALMRNKFRARQIYAARHETAT